MNTETVINIKLHTDGRVVAIAPAAVIKPAYHGAAALTATGGKVRGDKIRLRSAQRYGPQGWDFYPDAFTIQHPIHGEVVAAYVDTSEAGLAEAPQIRAICAQGLHESARAVDRADAVERKMAEGDR